MLTKTLLPALAALFSLTSAQNYPDQSAPFSLKISDAADASLNNKYLYACHSGAAIEQLCLGDKAEHADAYSTYYHNTSEWSSGTGTLVWNLPYSDGIASSGLTFAYNPASNVVLSYFIPGDSNAVRIGFNEENKLFVPAYIDDVLTPGGEKPFYNWEVCTTQFSGYRYQALAWVTVGTPVTGSWGCVSVNVTKEAI
ncbi:cell wall protein RHD3 [Podospora australis]|uniref:Cell wall protein RHD3 n=1 Tax=Podospora australis TaxID=1536484 RepID=A0AAN7AGA5_9PEZI|nr:cell wall protein RHD3 [Podospora australis]